MFAVLSNRLIRLSATAVSLAGAPGVPQGAGMLRAAHRYSPMVAKPSFQNVRLKAASDTLSPNH